MSNIYGVDVIRAYEVSWLNANGKPEIALLEIFQEIDQAPLDTWNLKKILENLNNEKFDDLAAFTSNLKQCLPHDFQINTSEKFYLLKFFEQLELEGTQQISQGFRYICNDSDQPQVGTLNIVCSNFDYESDDQTDSICLFIQDVLMNFRNSKYTIQKFIAELLIALQNKMTKDFLMSAHFHRRGGISYQAIRSTGNQDFSRFITRSILE